MINILQTNAVCKNKIIENQEVIIMAQVICNLLKDEELQKSIDPFYTESNMAYLKKVVVDIEFGKAVLVDHELIEDRYFSL